jgi:hypothetical protein
MSPHTPPTEPPCGVIELRQYTLHPGQREALIALFDHAFIAPQEAAGMAVIGQFRDLADADRFVWLRGFADMASRAQALGAFYGGPVWQAHRDAANATMVDSDNVLLLRPAWPGAGVPLLGRPRPAPGATAAAGNVEIRTFSLSQPASDALLALCRDTVSGLLVQSGARALGWYVTEPAPNNFPRLPVRTGEQVLVSLALFDNLAALDAAATCGAWDRLTEVLREPGLLRPADILRLAPTACSALHTADQP